MLSLAGSQQVHLAASGLERPQLPANPKQDGLCDVPEVEANTTPIATTIFPHLVPDEHGLVSETPRFHDLQRIRYQRVWRPQIAVRFVGSKLAHRQLSYLTGAESGVAPEPFMLRRYPSGPIGEPPRRISQNGPESLVSKRESKLVSSRLHYTLSMPETDNGSVVSSD
jgi:hypothetical protein